MYSKYAGLLKNVLIPNSIFEQNCTSLSKTQNARYVSIFEQKYTYLSKLRMLILSSLAHKSTPK